MKREICIAAALWCSFSAIGGWSDSLYRMDPTRSYITSVQEKSRIYSRQVHSVSQSEGVALLREYKRELQLRAEELVSEWQMDKEKEAIANEKEIERVQQAIGVRRAEYLHQFERLTELYADRYLQPQLAERRQSRNRVAGVNGLLQQVNEEMQLYT